MRASIGHQISTWLSIFSAVPWVAGTARALEQVWQRRPGAHASSRRDHFVFVSHCGDDKDDKPALKHLVESLARRRVQVWIDNPAKLHLRPEELAYVRGIPPGTNWERGAIHPALRQATCILVCWSRTAFKGEHEVFWKEVYYADVNETIIPCIIDDLPEGEIPEDLRKTQTTAVGLNLDAPFREAQISNVIEAIKQRIAAAIASEAAAARTDTGVPYDVNFKERKRPKANFSGRKSEFRVIRREFRSGKPCVAIHGMGGLGKTELAAEYLRRVEQKFRIFRKFHGALWFPAEHIPTLAEKIAAVGKAMNPPVEAADPEDDSAIACATMARLDGSGERILYVFDNVERPLDIKDLLPKAGSARVLVTSKFPEWQEMAYSLELKLFKPEEAQRFLLDHWRGPDPKGAAALAKELGYLPLALEQARATCNADKRTFAEYLKVLPKEMSAGQGLDAAEIAVSRTVRASLDTAQKFCADAKDMLEYLAFCSADSIPPRLVEGALKDRAREAIGALSKVSLVSRDESGNYSLHRTTQLVTRLRAQQEEDAAATALGRVVRRLGEIHPEYVTKGNWEECTELTPHLLSVVNLVRQHRNATWLQGSAKEIDLDRLYKLVVLVILYAPEGYGDKTVLAVPEPLMEVLGAFYEVEPLARALKKLVGRKPENWPSLLKQLISHNNYVMRHALAQALADAMQMHSLPVERATELLTQKSTMDEIEVGGYALCLFLARRPDRITAQHSELLDFLARQRYYAGCSILGDFMLNLALDERGPWPLHKLLPSERFWRSKWDHIRIDADAAEAAQAFMSKPRRRPVGARQAVLDDFDHFCASEERRLKLMRVMEKETQPAIAKLLRDYLSLGRNPDRIGNLEEQIEATPHLRELMGVLFAHPQWAVAEAAGTVLARIAGRSLKDYDQDNDDDPEPVRIITDSFDSPHWRVRYGAVEASYALRQSDQMKTFTDAVRRFYADPISRIRALCAEDLGDTILAASPDQREDMMRMFSAQLAAWLQDEDCWVLEHVHRFYSELKDVASEEGARLLSGQVSPLIRDAPDWPTWDRGRFLRHIEVRKAEGTA